MDLVHLRFETIRVWCSACFLSGVNNILTSHRTVFHQATFRFVSFRRVAHRIASHPVPLILTGSRRYVPRPPLRRLRVPPAPGTRPVAARRRYYF